MSPVRELPTVLLEEAGDWFLRVRSARADSELHAAWLNWIEQDPRHREAFAEVQALWDAVGQVDPPPWPRPEELADIAAPTQAGAAPGSTPAAVIGAQASTPGGKFPKRWRTGTWAVAASVVVAVATAFLFRIEGVATWLGIGEQQRIATARGEQQSTLLSDGSRIELGGLTGVDVQFTPQRRLVIAEEGEVFYRVEHDPTRPFVVQAGPVSVTAIGTAFSVRREAGAVSVVVTEGIVQVDVNAASPSNDEAVSQVTARAGERVRFDQGQLQAHAQPAHVDHDQVWRRGRLRFEEEPLRVVVANLNRYASRPIVIGDASLHELRFTGTIFDDSVEDWLAGVPYLFPVTLDRSDPQRVVLQRRK